MHPAFIKLIDGHDQVGVIEKSSFADTDVLPDHYSMTDRGMIDNVRQKEAVSC